MSLGFHYSQKITKKHLDPGLALTIFITMPLDHEMVRPVIERKS
jgi:hypothetical protein